MVKIRVSRGCTQARVSLLEAPKNPYREILGELSWSSLSPEGRFVRIREILQRGDETLERISFSFKVCGLPRHQFAQHVRARIGVDFLYKDPMENPNHYIFYTPVYEATFRGEALGSHDGGGFKEAPDSVLISMEDGNIQLEAEGFIRFQEGGKEKAQQLLSIPQGGWREIRDYLPLSYEQDYSFKIRFLALIGQCSRRLCLGEEAPIVANHYLQKAAVAERFPLLASVLKPVCLSVGRCLYAKNYTLSNAFGCLFSGCDYRHPKGTGYASFNQSCSDINTLKSEVKPHGVVVEMDLLKTPETFGDLSMLDQQLFLEGENL